MPVPNPLKIAFCTAILPLAGCQFSSKEQVAAFYILAPTQTAESADLAETPATRRVIGIEAPDLPEYLNRNSLVRRLSTHQVEVSDTERWAEPLAAGVTRTLQASLAARLQDTIIVDRPWQRPYAPWIVVSPAIFRLEADASSSSAHFDGAFHLFDGDSRELLHKESFQTTISGSGAGPATPKAMSRLLEAFAERIAAEIERLALETEPRS